MAYHLEPITKADHEKIFQDAEAFPRKKSWMTAAVAASAFPKNWAVDRERNCYLLCMPIMVRTDSMEEGYIAFVERHMHQVKLPNVFGQTVYIDEVPLPSGEALAALHQEISAGFAVLGKFGDGPKNEFGMDEFAIVPVFVQKGARA
ncbi:hypothetical protein [Massilia sp. TWP1-3-3]|uniref:hypothetical protein n=1 Tax=Massilia sp. TWP1-3-3 TaxID=2804573 RepID=UPI003CF1A0EA